MSIKSLIDRDDYKLSTCVPGALMKKVVNDMVSRKENAVCVLNSDGTLAGILTDHDVMRALAENEGNLGDVTVMNWMTSEVVTCDCGSKLTEALKMMGRHRIRHLIAVENDKPVAIVGIGDALSKVHENDEMEISVLRDIAVAHAGS